MTTLDERFASLEDKLIATLSDVRDLRALVAMPPAPPAPAPEPEPPAPPPPAPAPEPEPPAPPPPPAPAPVDPLLNVIQLRPLNRNALVFHKSFNPEGRYHRNIPNLHVPRGQWELVITSDARDSGVDDNFKSASYTVMCWLNGDPANQVQVAQFTPPAGTSSLKVMHDTTNIPDGPHVFEVVPADGPETGWPVWMHVGEVNPALPWAPAMTGSFGHQREEGWAAKVVRVPSALDPVVAATGYPLAPRTYGSMAGHPSHTQFYKRDLAPSINGDPPYLRTLDNGLRTTLNSHAYSMGSATAKLPNYALRDGPRGVGLVAAVTDIKIGRRGGLYLLQSSRLCHMDTSGHIKTLAGYRDTPSGRELVGDWSAIPPERRGMHEAWGFFFDDRTTAESGLDTSVLVDSGDGTMEHPHAGNPVGFIVDTQNNRTLRVEFNGRDRSAPAKITEFIVGQADPWDGVYYDGSLYINERLSHRIARYDATTGEFLEVFLQGLPLATVNGARFTIPSGTLEQRRAAPCVAPEGAGRLLNRPDGDWYYFGSRAAQQVKRINFATRVVEHVCYPFFDTSPAGSAYCKIAVRQSDGTVAVSSWETYGKSAPFCYKPDGTQWSIVNAASGVFREGRTNDKPFFDMGYSTACAIDDERIIYGGADFGLGELSMALPADPPAPDERRTEWVAGKAVHYYTYGVGKGQYEHAGYRLTHGVDGFGQFGLPLPWGVSREMDYYLTAQGHQKPVEV